MDKNFVDNPEVLTEHLRILYRIAWKLHHQTGHDVKDLFSESCVQYLLARNRFDPDNGASFTTFIWRAVWNGVVDYVRLYTKVVLVVEGEIPARTKHLVRDKFMHEAY